MAYRRGIRINGTLKKSPRFAKKADADKWYHSKYRVKQFSNEGQAPPVDDKMTVSEYFNTKWIVDREKRGYPLSTTSADRQRFRDYIEDEIGHFKVSKVSGLHIRAILKRMTEEGGLAVSTRNRVRSLLSKLFNDATIEESPLRADNPAYNISFNDPRSGKKKPKHLKKQSDIVSFLKAAKSLSRIHFAYASLVLMTGLRKQELIALKWNDFVAENHELVIDEKYIQAGNQIVPGTKAGSDEDRVVPISDSLVEVLLRYRKFSAWKADDDFILAKEDGSFIPPRDLSRLHDDIRKASGVDVHIHGLRHTYGRQFVLNDGNLKTLQAIMGHSNSSVTDLYSELAGKQAKKSRNIVSFNIEGDEGDDEN